MEHPPIPFFGGKGVPNGTRSGDVADWVEERHKIPLLLALSLYNGAEDELEGWKLIEGSKKIRSAMWFNNLTNEVIIGLRGTSLFQAGGEKDIQDDKVIAGFGESYCDLSLVKEGQEQYDSVRDQVGTVIFAGHSLGGTAAFCLCSKNDDTGAVIFNGGAAATNPVLSGPGERAVFYHIVGDLISSHMSMNACRVIRVKKPDVDFGIMYPHSSERILRSDGLWRYSTPDEEDEMFLKWGEKYKPGLAVLNPYTLITSYVVYLKKMDVAEKSPIPNSTRWNKMYG